MGFLRRALTIIVGLLLGLAAAVIFFPFAAMVDPALHEAGAIVLVLGLFALLIGAFHDLAANAFGVILFIAYVFAMLVAAAPIVIAALIGEVARLRSVAWYAGASGALAAVLPFALKIDDLMKTKDAAANPPSDRLSVVFFLTGAVGGLVYWAIAGRGRDRPAA